MTSQLLNHLQSPLQKIASSLLHHTMMTIAVSELLLLLLLLLQLTLTVTVATMYNVRVAYASHTRVIRCQERI